MQTEQFIFVVVFEKDTKLECARGGGQMVGVCPVIFQGLGREGVLTATTDRLDV